MTYSVREHINEYLDADLKKCVARFLELLNKREFSDNDVGFSPVTITSCRVLYTVELNDILTRLKELVKDDEEKKEHNQTRDQSNSSSGPIGC